MDEAFQADTQALRSWWAGSLRDEPPSSDTRSLWFGLFEGEQGTTLYVQGYREFDADDETAEWATTEPSWAPDGRYIHPQGVVRSARWEEALDTALRLLDELRPALTWPGELDGVAAGFDDGDAHVIWKPSASP